MSVGLQQQLFRTFTHRRWDVGGESGRNLARLANESLQPGDVESRMVKIAIFRKRTWEPSTYFSGRRAAPARRWRRTGVMGAGGGLRAAKPRRRAGHEVAEYLRPCSRRITTRARLRVRVMVPAV